MQDRRQLDADRPLRRREAMRTLGGAGLGALALAVPGARGLGRVLGASEARAQASCALSPELTEGPYYVADAPLRRNVLERRPGVVLFLSVKVVDAQACAPLADAVVDIWHADAGGEYSAFGSADGDTFMRGRQAVGDVGVATFRTVYPGWYPGRTPHIHVKVHVGGSEVHTGQLFFDEVVTAAVYAQEPYASRGNADTSNASDGIFVSGGAQSTLALVPRGAGYWGSVTLVVAS